MDRQFSLYPKQGAFVNDPTRHVGFVAGIGSGKSFAGAIKALFKTQRSPGSLGTITAPTYPMLRDATKRTFFEVVPPELIVYRNDSENICGILTPTGQVSEILFRSTSDPSSLRGPNLTWIWMDEAAMSEFESFQILQGRIRAGDPEEQQLFITTTPKGFNWIYEKFGPQVLDPAFHAYFAETKDNIFLPQAYLDSIYQQYTGQFAQQELEGKFAAYEGLIYGDLFNYNNHVGNFPYNPDLPVELAWDFGYPSAEAVLFIQQDASGHVYIIDEVYRMKSLTEDIAAEVKSKPCYNRVSDGIGDEARPDAIKRLQDLDIPIRPSQKGKIIDGVKLVRTLLANDKVTSKPMLHIDKRCVMLLTEFGKYRWADKNVSTDEYSDKPIDQWNHALDALRMWVKMKWRGAPKTVIPDEKRRAPKRRIMAYQYL